MSKKLRILFLVSCLLVAYLLSLSSSLAAPQAEALSLADFLRLPTIAGGDSHTVGLKKNGAVIAVGTNYKGEMNVRGWTNIKAVAAGWDFTVGLKTDGTVVAVGDNFSGQTNVAGWTNIKAIAAGWYHSVGLKNDGTVVAVGKNNYGQLNVARWKNIGAIAAGSGHTVGLKESGRVVAAGYNFSGQTNVGRWTNIRAIAAGYLHTVGLKKNGTVVAVGAGAGGRTNVARWTDIRQPPYIKTALSLLLEPRTINLGQATTIKGTLKHLTGEPVANKNVKIAVNGIVIKTLRTNLAGAFSYRSRPERSAIYKALFGGDSFYAGAGSRRIGLTVNR